MKSGGNFTRLSINVSHDLTFGNKMTALPVRLMNTSGKTKLLRQTYRLTLGSSLLQALRAVQP
jgi:hypothetical protein